MFLMRDEKEERKKQARSNKQTRQSNTAHPRVHRYTYMYTMHLNQASKVKQTNKAKQHSTPKAVTFPTCIYMYVYIYTHTLWT